MKITSPVDIESTLETGRDLAADAAETIAMTFDKVGSRAESRAADLLDAATTKDGKPKSRVLLIGAVVVVLVGLVLRRRIG